MGVTNYHTINGRIVGQTKDGVRTHYVPDALGSVVATLDANGTVENTYRYKPYGSLLAKTGTGDDPRFMWVGTFGYRETGERHSTQYIRARHYAASPGCWTSVDPYWPFEPAFSAFATSPTANVDPSGRFVVNCTACPKMGDKLSGVLGEFCKVLSVYGADAIIACVNRCMRRRGLEPIPIDKACLSGFCLVGSVTCKTCNGTIMTRCPKSYGCCFESVLFPECASTLCGSGPSPTNSVTFCCNALSADFTSRCLCLKPVPINCDHSEAILFHELGHVCGSGPGCNDDTTSGATYTQDQLNGFGLCMLGCIRDYHSGGGAGGGGGGGW